MSQRRLTGRKRLALYQVLPPQKCRARRTNGQRCSAWAMVASPTCRAHGSAAGQVRAKARERIALAEMIAAGERRAPLEIMASALHIADSMMIQSTQDLAEPPTATQVLALVDALERAGTLAHGLLRLGLDWDAREAVRRQGAALATVVREVVRQLGHDPNDLAVSTAFRSALRLTLGSYVPEPPEMTRAIEGRPS